MICKQCGAELPDNALACKFCGEPVPAEIADNAVSIYDNAYQNDAPEKPQKPNTGIVVVNVFLAIIATILVFSALVIMSIRYIFTADGITTLLQTSQVSTTDIIDYDMLYDELGITTDDEKLTKEVDKLMGETTSNMIEFFITGEGDPIDVDLIMSFIEDNADIIEEAGNEKITDEMLEELEDELKAANKEFKEEYEIGAYYDEEYMTVVRTLYSPALYLVPLFIGLGLYALIFALFGRFVDKSLIYTGVSLIVASIFSGLTGALIRVIEQALGAEYNPIFGIISGKVFTGAGIMFVLGIVLIVAGNVIRSNRKNQM